MPVLRRKTAFTLIEMLVVVVIIAVITTMVSVSARVSPRRRLRGQVRMLISDLIWAREYAAAKQITLTQANFDVADRRYTLYRDSLAPANLMEARRLEVNSIALTWDDPLRTDEFIEFLSPDGNIGGCETVQIDLTYRGASERITIFCETGFIQWP